MKFLKFLSFILSIMFLWVACTQPSISTKDKTSDSFSFVFMTDIHLQPEKNAIQGFQKAIDYYKSVKT